MGVQVTLMFGFCCMKVLSASVTSLSSAGEDAQPATTRLTFPLSALAAELFVFVGQGLSGLPGPFAPPPVPVVPPPPPQAARSTTRLTAQTSIQPCRRIFSLDSPMRSLL